MRPVAGLLLPWRSRYVLADLRRHFRRRGRRHLRPCKGRARRGAVEPRQRRPHRDRAGAVDRHRARHRRAQGPATKLDRQAWLFLALSGVATCVSWVAYFKALAMGSATPVTAIDKASLVVTWMLSVAFLGETLGWRTGIGVGLVFVGAFLMSGKVSARAVAARGVGPRPVADVDHAGAVRGLRGRARYWPAGPTSTRPRPRTASAAIEPRRLCHARPLVGGAV